MAGRPTSVSGSTASEDMTSGSLSQCSEERPDVAHEQFRLLERCKMATLFHLAPMGDVREVRLHPASHWRNDLLGEHSDPGGHIDHRPGSALAKAFPTTSSLFKVFSGCPCQSVQAQNFSKTHAACPAGESVSP